MDLFTTGAEVAVPSELTQLFEEDGATVSLPELEQGGASPVYSDSSSDSGVISSLADEDQFSPGCLARTSLCIAAAVHRRAPSR